MTTNEDRIDREDAADRETVSMALPMDAHPELLADPFGCLDALRSQHRALYNTQPHAGSLGEAGASAAWMLLQYEDVHEAFQRYDIFSSEGCLDPTDGQPRSFPRLIPEELDPPEHAKYRQLLNPLFTPGRVRELEPSIRAHCVSLIEGLVDRGRCDLVADFARRYPTIIFMRLMGLPVDDADTFLDWADGLMHSTPETDPDGAKRMSAAMDVFGYLGELLEQRRKEPQDDIVSYLLTCEVDGRELEPLELLQIAFLLYMAGLDTVAGALGYMFSHLAEHPEHRLRIIDDADCIPAAVEEFLRAYSIVTPVRVVTQDVEFAGCPMREGDRVLLPTFSANRDDREFASGREVVFDRAVNRHMAFGAGPHRCVGSHLARTELRIALEEWHRRIPEYHIDDPARLRQHVAGVAGFDALPLRWGS